MKATYPYLIFDGNAEEAFTYYRSVFGGEFSDIVRFRDMQGCEEMPEEARDRIAHVSLPIGKDDILMASDTPDSVENAVTSGTNYFINIEPESAEEADRLFDALSADGRITMPLQATEWAEKHGMCADRFGIQWMVNYTGSRGMGS